MRRRHKRDLLNPYRLQHAVGIEGHGAAPERRLQDVVQRLAPALFSGLHKQASPFKRAQDAG